MYNIKDCMVQKDEMILVGIRRTIMEEISMKKRMRKVIFFSVCLTLFLFVAGFAMAKIFVTTFNHATEERMHEEADNYKERIERQIERNFQMLNTLASCISIYELEQKEDFQEALIAADAQNDFQAFGFFKPDGEGILSKPYYEQETDGSTKMNVVRAEIREAALQTMQGEEVVSDVFSTTTQDEKVLVFGVPVYRDGEIVGALMASDVVDAFSELLDAKYIFYGKGYVHLLDADGNYLIRGTQRAVQEDVQSVLEKPYLDEKEIADVRRAMKNQEEVEFSFEYQKKEYNGLLEPIQINGWYLFCVNSPQNVNQNIYIIAYVAAGFFCVVTGIFFITLVYGYRMMKNMNGNLRRMAYYDELTGTYNIHRFTQLVQEQGIERSYAVAVVNVRQFKFINEIFGKEQADLLLQFIAMTLEEMLEPGEFVSRESADMFYLFLKETNPERLYDRMEKALEKITNVKKKKSSNYHLSLRCGIAVSEQGVGAEDLMTRAMFALAKAKQASQQAIWLFDTTLHEQEQMDNFIESHAREALEKGEFELYLQPKIMMADDTLGGAEALVRWVNDEGRMLYPSAFIPLFETNGFCAELDMYMFENVCRCLHQWIEEGYDPIPISINQSKLTFYEEDYEQRLCKLLEKYHVPASLITLEILEDLVIEDLSDMNARLDRLRKIGFKISMDDFGTGYSSLNTLGKLKIDEVKLDRGFLLETVEAGDRSTRMIMEEVVRLSKKLSIATVIEGIETEEQEAFVKSIGCDQGQGYLYSKPIGVEKFTQQILAKYAHKPHFLGGGAERIRARDLGE